MTPTPAAGPRTDAGRALLFDKYPLTDPYIGRASLLRGILAIEAEARAGLDVERLIPILHEADACCMAGITQDRDGKTADEWHWHYHRKDARKIAAAYGGRDEGLDLTNLPRPDFSKPTAAGNEGWRRPDVGGRDGLREPILVSPEVRELLAAADLVWIRQGAISPTEDFERLRKAIDAATDWAYRLPALRESRESSGG